MNNKKELLPLGSIVYLQEGTQKSLYTIKMEYQREKSKDSFL